MTEIIIRQTTLPAIGEFTESGWTPPTEMTEEEWENAGPAFLTLLTVQNAINWWTGDWLNEGDKRYGKTYEQAQRITGWKLNRLKNYKWVSRRVKKSTRVDSLSWAHHREVAKIESTEDQALWLERSEANRWSVSELKAALGGQVPVSISSETRRLNLRTNDEWWTPVEYVAAARTVMGGIDCDPASSVEANERIGAEIYYSVADNGLEKHWQGRVWLNPPYGMKGPLFVTKLLSHFETGDVTQAILLLNSNPTETKWFGPLWDHSLCFTDHRIKFVSPFVKGTGPTHGSVFVYLGPNREAFIREFERFGPIVARVRRQDVADILATDGVLTVDHHD